MVNSFLGVAGVGLLFFLVGRIGYQGDDPMHFGCWRQAPRWARIMFGSIGESISAYNLSLELCGLTWIICALGIVATGDPPGPPLRQLLAAPALFSFVGCVVCWVVVSVGQALRDWRER